MQRHNVQTAAEVTCLTACYIEGRRSTCAVLLLPVTARAATDVCSLPVQPVSCFPEHNRTVHRTISVTNSAACEPASMAPFSVTSLSQSSQTPHSTNLLPPFPSHTKSGYCYVRAGTHFTRPAHHDNDTMYMLAATYSPGITSCAPHQGAMSHGRLLFHPLRSPSPRPTTHPLSSINKHSPPHHTCSSDLTCTCPLK